MKEPDKKPTVQLSGKDGNVFFILGTVRQALRKSGADEEHVQKFLAEAKEGDYDHAIQTCMKYVNVV